MFTRTQKIVEPVESSRPVDELQFIDAPSATPMLMQRAGALATAPYWSSEPSGDDFDTLLPPDPNDFVSISRYANALHNLASSIQDARTNSVAEQALNEEPKVADAE